MHDASKVVKREDALVDGALIPRRIAVIGRSGAGKTTVALELGRTVGLPVVHLDRLAWEPGWRPVEHAVFESRHAAAIAADSWVIDGGYLAQPGWPERVRRADVVLLVEAPLHVCLWRIVRRSLARRPGVPRPDQPDGCRDSLSLSLIAWTLLWSWRTRAALRPLLRADPALPLLLRVRTG
jgi:adenylate kinase family enzyme